jgi:steroid delta-isomerase-like uncharacterized protein
MSHDANKTPAGPPDYKLTEANKALVRRYVEEVVIGGNFAVAPDMVGPNFKIERSAVSAGISGPEGVQRLMAMMGTAFPDLALRIVDLFGEGDRVAVRFEGPATHLGEFFGIPATGAKVNWQGIVIYLVQDGRIQHEWADFDDAGVVLTLRQAAADRAKTP